MGDLSIRLLGPMEVGGPDGVITISRAQTRLVLAILAMRAGRPVPIEQLADLVWNGEPPDSAAESLYSHASRLRSALGAETLVSRSSAYVLDIDEGSVDALRFVWLVSEGRRLVESGDQRGAIEILTQGLRLWRGTALDSFLDVEFLRNAAVQLDSMYLEAVEERAEARLAAGDYSVAVTELEAHVVEHPLRERAWASLIVALHRGGRRADAIVRYQSLRQHLDEELGVEPSLELQALNRAVMEDRADLKVQQAWGGESALESADGRTRIPLVGRRLTVGRSPSNDITIDDLTVSRSHAVLERIGGAWVVRDVGSANGTSVDGSRVTDVHALRDGARVAFGTSTFVCRASTAETISASETVEVGDFDLMLLAELASRAAAAASPALIDEVAARLGRSVAQVLNAVDRLYDRFQLVGADRSIARLIAVGVRGADPPTK